MKLNKLDEFFEAAFTIAKEESSDAEMQVGVVVDLMEDLKNEEPYLVGAANHYVIGAEDLGLPNTRPDKYEYILHAEANLVALSARMGYSLDNKTVYCTLSPCPACMRTLFQAGVTSIYFKDLHKSYTKELRDIKVAEEKVGEYTKLTLTNYA